MQHVQEYFFVEGLRFGFSANYLVTDAFFHPELENMTICIDLLTAD